MAMKRAGIMTSNSLSRFAKQEDFDFLWNPVHRKRAQKLSDAYDRNRIKVWLRYVIEGGARDMYEFMDKYSNRFNYMKSKGWTEIDGCDQERFYSRIQKEMERLSADINFSFLYCPFMRKRALELVDSGVDSDLLRFILYFVLVGRKDSSHANAIDLKAKDSYLIRTGIINQL